MTKEEFFEVFNLVLTENKFRKRGSVYHKGNHELQIFVDKQRSSYSATYYINYRIYLCGPEEIMQHIKYDGQEDLRARLSFKKEGKEYYSLELELLDVQQAIYDIQKGAAWLDSLLQGDAFRDFLIQNPEFHVIMSPRLKQWSGVGL